MYYAPAAAETVVKYESPPVGKFGSGHSTCAARKGATDVGGARVACYKSFSPCSVILESGYPFSGSVLSGHN